MEQGAKFTVGEHTAVLDDDLRPVAPGSGAIGHLARRGHVPLGYYKDAQKSAELMVEVDGVRWALTGDAATVEADGTVVLLGRGSVSINTGGEKVYPEEVEAVVKDHPAVYDAVVVGAPDERWGERVVAVVGAPTRCDARARRACSSTVDTRSPATSCRANCSASTTSNEDRTAKPTTDRRDRRAISAIAR